ncbi:MAG: HAD family hydrolase [Candidatus Bathyarchaeia archaeon]
MKKLKKRKSDRVKITTILCDVGDTLHNMKSYTSIAWKISIEKLVDQGVPIADVTRTLENQRLFERIITECDEPHADRYFLEESFFQEFFKQIHVEVDFWQLNSALITYRDILRSLLKPSPVVISTLSVLKGKGYKMGVVTDGSRKSAHEILHRLGITQFFDAIVISEDVGVEKPDPKIFQKALIRLDSKPSQSIMVGDSIERDINGAKKLGMVTVLMQGYLPRKEEREHETEIEPDYKIQRFDELLGILKRMH